MTKLIEPAIAKAVARRVAGHGPDDPRWIDDLRRELEVAVPRAETLVAEVGGIAAPARAPWMLIDRATWAETNVTGINTLLAPLADKIARRLDRSPLPVRVAQRSLLSVEVGVVLGYVARRVLGQYDLLVTDTGAPRRRRRALASGGIHDPGDATLYFVGPNMIDTQRRLRFVPHDFVLWVAVHEMTHRFQFTGVPWLQGHFLELVEAYISSVELDAKGLAARLRTAARRLASKSLPPEERNPVYLLASDEQRAVLDQLQALMAVIEGHGNYVMDAVGEDAIPSFKRMRSAFDRRRTQMNLIQRAISNVLGLEMKLRQYETGQRFCEKVTERDRAAALTHLWSDPSNLPTAAELKEPDLWLKRVA